MHIDTDLFRLLEMGEAIEKTDEAWTWWTGPECEELGWMPLHDIYEGAVIDEGHVPVRRPLPNLGPNVGAVTEDHGLAKGYFGFWTDGWHHHRYTPAMECELSDCQPFVVRLDGEGWIPANLLVWAQDEKHATERVMEGLVTCRALWTHRNVHGSHERVERLLKEIANGELKIRVTPLDWRLILEVPWADNHGL